MIRLNSKTMAAGLVLGALGSFTVAGEMDRFCGPAGYVVERWTGGGSTNVELF